MYHIIFQGKVERSMCLGVYGLFLVESSHSVVYVHNRYCFCAGGPEDVDTDRSDVCVEEFFHHHWDVPADSLLRLSGGHSVWHSQAWLQPWKVKSNEPDWYS